ncbi:hypothetical protein NNO07_11060 [Pseudomonas resinovorans]|uniref:Mor transcription activator domain-containing protein n=1 Tax=Metapseudomonas resinovorans TaxID=53412 RepID=A0ABT4Y430_METRE|nr:Mor transcription activator family protein [Pseudomonas resinovorans]MDA8483612.1 hypothetical protein [Pseudomonas resinovorans]
MKLEQVKELLPRQILEIADIVGLPTAMRLVDELGGTSWEFAQGASRIGMIKVAALGDILGEEAAELLTSRLGGDKIYIPQCSAALRRLRDLEIHRQFEQAVRKGTSANAAVAELARLNKLSDRRIWLILKRPMHSATSDSPGLFD